MLSQIIIIFLCY